MVSSAETSVPRSTSVSDSLIMARIDGTRRGVVVGVVLLPGVAPRPDALPAAPAPAPRVALLAAGAGRRAFDDLRIVPLLLLVPPCAVPPLPRTDADVRLGFSLAALLLRADEGASLLLSCALASLAAVRSSEIASGS